MSKKIAVGIDVGSYQIKVVVTELVKKDNKYVPEVIGKGLHKSKGLMHGYIVNKNEVSRSIISAVEQAETQSGVKIKKAFISIGGVSLEGINLKSTTIITRADLEVTQIDLDNINIENEKNPALLNKKIISAIPIEYKIDDKKVLGNPIGMQGSKLKSEILYITCLKQHLHDLIQAIEEVDIEVEDVYASPIAGSFVTLTKSQKIAGCVLANLGSETVSIIVFENDIPISLEILPIGSTNITNNIALELKTTLEEAEKIKHGILTSTIYPKKKLDEIVKIQLENIFKLIEAHLKKINRNALLPAGIIISGGGSGITTIKDLAEAYLNIPSRIANLNFINNSSEIIHDSTWAVAYGLCLMGLSSDREKSSSFNSISGFIKQIKNWIAQYFV
ncbi:MAG: cell division protein FtsA [Candidatus Pacebacteria bacterium]|nr:cell division protein FtsA [Candidatus Paceibacterota bacterium]